MPCKTKHPSSQPRPLLTSSPPTLRCLSLLCPKRQHWPKHLRPLRQPRSKQGMQLRLMMQLL